MVMLWNLVRIGKPWTVQSGKKLVMLLHVNPLGVNPWHLARDPKGR